jgi:hypothetical protein
VPATQLNSLEVGGYGERKLPTKTSSPSDPAAQPETVSWVMLAPPLTAENSPLVSLGRPKYGKPLAEQVIHVEKLSRGRNRNSLEVLKFDQCLTIPYSVMPKLRIRERIADNQIERSFSIQRQLSVRNVSDIMNFKSRRCLLKDARRDEERHSESPVLVAA